MLSFPVSVIIYTVEMLISYVVFSYLGNRKQSAPVTLCFGFVLFLSGALVNVLFSNTMWINITYTAVINTVFARVGFEISWKASFLLAFLLDVISVAFELVSVLIFSSLLGVSLTEYNTDSSVLIIESATSKMLYFVVCILLLRLNRNAKTPLDRIPASFYFYPFCSLSAFVIFWYICRTDTVSETTNLLLSDLSIAFLGVSVSLFVTYRHNIERDNEFIRVKNENLRLQLEKDYYDILDRQNQELMLYAHDAKKHLSAIQHLNTDEQVGSYVQALSDELKTYTNTCRSGNKILDVIINKYATECKLHGITFQYDVKECNLLHVQEIDLVAILGNLLDNALNSASNSSEKNISIETTFRNAYHVIIVKNSCDAAPAVSGKRLLSMKGDGQIHGLGLKNVKRALEKYSGDYSWDYDNSKREFIVTAMLK